MRSRVDISGVHSSVAVSEGLRRRFGKPAAMGLAAAFAVVVCVGCGAAGGGTGAAAGDALGVGVTRVATSARYIVVMNVVPPEVMYTPAQVARGHPTSGELILRGHMAPIGPQSRHTEAHVYSRRTGRPVTDVTPVITLTDEVSGKTVQPEATLMEDLVVGSRDIHFGNNVVIPVDHEFALSVRLGADRLDFSGRL